LLESVTKNLIKDISRVKCCKTHLALDINAFVVKNYTIKRRCLLDFLESDFYLFSFFSFTRTDQRIQVASKT